MDNKIISDNKLIAEFMGGKYDKDTSFPIHPDDMWLPYHGIVNANTLELGKGNIMLYHKSWDWLMPVVDKIENIVHTTDKARFYFSICKNYVEIKMHPFIKDFPIIDINVDPEKKLIALYTCVILFIKWYNKKVD
jgi:hypothetical protein